jgi:outer membrane protein OmpA-like peptidoglycan-associated protein
MKTLQLIVLASVGAMIVGCTTLPPDELVKARAAYEVSAAGPAAELAPAELHKAQQSLLLAEKSFIDDPKSYKTKDLAYVAMRKAELAGAHGAIATDKGIKGTANADYQKKQTEIVKQGKQNLVNAEKLAAERRQDLLDAGKRQEVVDANRRTDDMRNDLSDANRETDTARLDLNAANRETEIANKALTDANMKSDAALAQLALLSMAKEEPRGLVLTLSGSVLFRFNEATLLPTANAKLDQVSKALLDIKDRNLIVEGYTDSKGPANYNQDLSQRRAEMVRNYLVDRGYPESRIQTVGKGENYPIANNKSPEGRANNRRVEIVIERKSSDN